jgi:hypothetical protein
VDGWGHKESVWKASTDLERKARIPRRVRIALIVGVGFVLVAVALVFRSFNVTKPIELQAISEAGATRVELSDEELRPMSPGCGCLDPSFGAHEWFGMNLPSSRFDMKLISHSSDKLEGKRWGLTALSPELAPIDWFESPNHSLAMSAVAYGGDRRRVLFKGRTTYPLILTEDEIEVSYGKRFPYAALLPGAGGAVEFNSEQSSRPEFGSVMDVRAFAPARDEIPASLKFRSEREYRSHTEITQRGPMVDVLGPVVHLTIPTGRNLRLFAGYRPITGFRSSDWITITLRTPYSIRLFPQPATHKWVREHEQTWGEIQQDASQGNKRAQRHLHYGPSLVGRTIDGSATPEYAVHLDNIWVPSSSRWHQFAATSSHHGEVSQMLSNHKLDPQLTVTYQLPPVERNVEVGIFGPLTELESSSMRGDLFTDGKDVSLGQGQDISIHSKKGLSTGHDQMTPLVSAGPPTEQANAAGKASVSINGEPVNTLPFVPVLVGAVAIVLLGLAIEAIVKWGLKPT